MDALVWLNGAALAIPAGVGGIGPLAGVIGAKESPGKEGVAGTEDTHPAAIFAMH